MSSSGREQRLRELLDAALDLPPEERRAALEAATDDETLRDEATELLDREEALGGFLGAPAVAMFAGGGRGGDGPAAPPEQPLPTVPGYTIERSLGSGGMGWVYLARQDGPAPRTVAIKMIRATVADPEVARRFALEQHALARLNHPAIAQLYAAAATPDGRPYVAMEYVDGEPITVWCDRHRLSVEARLRLFVAVCRGVEHAHRRQLLHRDLKPSNLLVTSADEVATPKIIDFGIARILRSEDDAAEDDPLRFAGDAATGGRILGTPHYMSPEALAPSDGPRDLDTRADVYSLGVVLYELLTGTRPFTARDEDVTTLLRRIAENDPPRPSTRVSRHDRPTLDEISAARAQDGRDLARRLDGDLDWIVLKALARNREERYGSAAALADDIERSLRDEPVTARPPSVGDRLGKLVRRHRLAAALVATTLAAIVSATVLTSLALVRTTRAEHEARSEAAANRQVLAFLVDLFKTGSPEESRGRDVSARELIERGTERIDQMELEPLQRARLLHTLAEVQMRLGNYAEGRRLATEALALRRRWLDPGDDAVMKSLDLLGTLDRRVGRLDEAETLLERQLALAEERPDDPALLADALNSLANLRWRQHRLAEAEALQRRALAIRRSLAGEDGAGTEDVAASLNNLGVMLWAEGNLDEAETVLGRAVEAFETAYGPDHPRVADAQTNLGAVKGALGDWGADQRLQRRALAIDEKVLGPDHPTTSANLHNLALALQKTGDLDEAEALGRRALEIRRRTLGDDHPETLRTMSNLATVLQEQGRYDAAETLLRQVLESRTRTLGPAHGDVARTLYRLGLLAREAGREEDATGLLRRALAIQRTLDPPRPKQLAETLDALETQEVETVRAD